VVRPETVKSCQCLLVDALLHSDFKLNWFCVMFMQDGTPSIVGQTAGMPRTPTMSPVRTPGPAAVLTPRQLPPTPPALAAATPGTNQRSVCCASSCVKYLLWVSQPGQFSLPSLWGWCMSSNYMDYVGGDHWTADQGCVWLFGGQSALAVGLAYSL